MAEGAGVPHEHVRVSRVVGENDEGITLFVPKAQDGVFKIEEGDRFLTILFCIKDESAPGNAMLTWLPWEG